MDETQVQQASDTTASPLSVQLDPQSDVVLDNKIRNFNKLKTDIDGTIITFDLKASDTHTVTLQGNRRLAIVNAIVGQKFYIRLVQDSVGSRTVTWFQSINWAGGGPPSLTTTANAVDTFMFLVIATY